jgi:hypothetical protein
MPVLHFSVVDPAHPRLPCARDYTPDNSEFRDRGLFLAAGRGHSLQDLHRTQPLQENLGGFVLGIVWTLIGGLLQGSFSNPVEGHLATFVRVFAMIVLPLSILGLAWGWTERIGLKRRLAINSAQPLRAIKGWVLRQTAKAMVCGALFGYFTYRIGLIRAFQPWDSAEVVSANVTGVLGFAVLAAPVGLVVGAISRGNLRRHLSSVHLQKIFE